MWRAKERAANQSIGHGYVAHVLPASGVHALKMVHCMVAVAVSAPLDFLQQLGMTPDIVTNHEKGGFDIMLVKNIQHPWSDLGDGAIIKGEIHHLAVAPLDAPVCFGEQEAI